MLTVRVLMSGVEWLMGGILNISVPESTDAVMRLLEGAGFECFVVGGFLRDSLLGRPTYDIDLATSATPEDVMRCLSRYSVIPTGLQHGTVTVLTDDGPLEITTFREDGSYSDYRHPDEVQFAKTIEEDLSRRDFTINALAWNEKRGLIDPWDGQEDLQKGVIRTVGDANQRFREDALRIFRGLRLSAELAFPIEGETGKAMLNCKHLLQFVAPERLQVELNRLIVGENALPVIRKHMDVLLVVIPELATLAEKSPALLDVALLRMSFVSEDVTLRQQHPVCRNSLTLMSQTKADVGLRLAALFRDLDHAAEVLKRLRYDGATIDRVEKLIRFQDEDVHPDRRSVWRAIRAYGQEIFLEGMKLRVASGCALTGCERVFAVPASADEGASSDSALIEEASSDSVLIEEDVYGLSKTLAIGRIAGDLIRSGRVLELKDLAVDGHDLLKLGYKGKEIGQTLEKLLENVCVDCFPNTRESLLDYIGDKKENSAGSS